MPVRVVAVEDVTDHGICVFGRCIKVEAVRVSR